MASPLQPKLTYVSSIFSSLKITDEMGVDENRIPELHFPGEEVTFYGRLFFLRQL